MPIPSSQVRRPMVQLGLLNLALYELVLGLEMILWKTFYVSSTFATARAVTGPITKSLGMPPLYLWGLGFIIAAGCLAFIFTDRPWVIGLFGCALSGILMLGLALSFLHTTHISPVHRDDPGIFGATTAFFICLMFIEITIATWVEHRRRR